MWFKSSGHGIVASLTLLAVKITELKVIRMIIEERSNKDLNFYTFRNNSLKLRRRTSIRTPAVAGLKNKLNAMKKTYLEENEAKPLVR